MNPRPLSSLAEPILLRLDEGPPAARPKATYRERVVRGERRNARQMSLF